MTGKLDWQKIESVFALGGYDVDVALTDSAAFLSLLGLTLLQPDYLWQNYDDFDDVETAIDDAISQIMNGNSLGGDMIKIAEAVATADCADLEIDNFVSGTFHTYKLIIQGLKSDDDGAYVDHLGIEFNDNNTAAHYSTFCRFVSLAQYTRYEHLGTVGFFQADWFCSTTTGNLAAIGHAEFTIYDPQGDDYKTIVGNGFVNNFNTDNIPDLFMRGVFLNAAEVTKIRIFPVLGTQFKIVPASASYPSELRMTLYGLK